MAQYVDPAVSRAKLERELSEYRANEQAYRDRGWQLWYEQFPELIVLMAVPQLRPPPIVFGVRLLFENYDAQPPSVHLVKPFTHEPFRTMELPTNLPYATETIDPQGQVVRVLGAGYLQASSPDEVPFFCHPGVREYHAHPGHDGELWELIRGRGEGRLVRLLTLCWEHGILPLKGYAMRFGVDPARIPVAAA